MNYKWNQLHSRNSLLYASILVTTRMEVCCFIIWNSWYFRLWQSETSHSSIHTTYSVKENYTLQKDAWIINWIKTWIQKVYRVQERMFYGIYHMIPYIDRVFRSSIVFSCFWLFDLKYGQFPYRDQVQYFHSWVLSKSKREFLYLVESILRFRLL